MPAQRPSTDGETLFRNALLTVCKSDKPRDGGAAVGVFSDWIQENASSSGVFFYDQEGTGFILFVAALQDQLEIGCVDFSHDDAASWKVPAADLRDALGRALRWFWE